MEMKRFLLCAMMICCLSVMVHSGKAENKGLSLTTVAQQVKMPQALLGYSFSYQGRLLDAGSPANGAYDFQFSLYNDATAGSQVGSVQTRDDVTVTDGLFIVELDFGNVFDGTALYLEIGVRPGASSGAYTPLSPRQPLTATPYALYSKGAPWSGLTGVPSGFADGVDDTDDTVSWSEISGIVGTGSSQVAAGDHNHWGASWTGSGTGLQLQSSDSDAFIARGIAIGVDAISDYESGMGIRATQLNNTGVNYGVWGRTYSTAGHGVYGYASNPSGTNYGVYGKSESSSGTGVYGYAPSVTGTTYGVYGKADSASGTGIFGEANKATGTNYGVYGTSISSSGTGVYGGATAASGTTYGVHGNSTSTTGRGVYGDVTAATGTNYGVYGSASSSAGRGVYGEATSGSGATYGVYGSSSSTTGRGVYGDASAGSGVNYGVYGHTSSSSGYGVYAESSSGVALRVAGSGIIKSTADIEVAVSPLKMVPYYDHHIEIKPYSQGFVELHCLDSYYANQYVYIPIDIPSVLFGTALKLKSVRICYRCGNSASYIEQTDVRYVTDSGTYAYPLTDGTDRTSTSWDNYTITTGVPQAINGSLFIYFHLYFTSSGSDHQIRIGKITLTLTEE
jgi:hypothetical protein